MIYLVYKPARKKTALITNDLDKAKKKTQSYRQMYLDKGWNGWANRVHIKSPNNKQYASKLANYLIDQANTVDMMNQSGSL